MENVKNLRGLGFEVWDLRFEVWVGAGGQVPKVEVFGENFISRPDPYKKEHPMNSDALFYREYRLRLLWPILTKISNFVEIESSLGND